MSACPEGVYPVDFQLTVDTTNAIRDIELLRTFLTRTLALMRRLGLPEDIERGAMVIQRFIMLLTQARLAALALQAASGPVGWGIAAVGVAGTALTAGDTLEYMMRGA